MYCNALCGNELRVRGWWLARWVRGRKAKVFRFANCLRSESREKVGVVQRDGGTNGRDGYGEWLWRDDDGE